jgi:cytochrome oxidase assembly protein ShyY1
MMAAWATQRQSRGALQVACLARSSQLGRSGVWRRQQARESCKSSHRDSFALAARCQRLVEVEHDMERYGSEHRRVGYAKRDAEAIWVTGHGWRGQPLADVRVLR